ncbi:ADP-ribosylglycohydrolase family protein [Actinokineospora sp. UTMC 2448]|uniref:ADP-ribosylglycohydrolase family protein n=1 Tax=Actinokineospora sp. UTMC 2448 TaxID=2268449 RepID=UPI0021648197|nr:ADP-ribosylglycohydrolase family protein [Actinokineospora sp. UTMC 2448]UVS78592.1 ADP-ribosylglycohydrolase [Actinokineospora sp. UTMC 2448]
MPDIVYGELPVVDTEWDGQALPGEPTPVRAILRWEQVPVDARWLPNGPARPNPDYVDGYRWIGFPAPANRLELLVGYLRRQWITRETFLRHVLDCEVYLPAEIDSTRGPVTVPVAGSLDRVPRLYPRVVRTQLKVWRRTADPRHSAVIELGGKPFNWPISSAELFETPESDTPEVEPAELVLPELEPGVACADLNRAAEKARAGGRGFSVAEARVFGKAARIWRDNLERRRAGQPESWPDDLRSAGLIERYDADGVARPRPWNFGKFGEQVPNSVFSAFALSGAYVGFALGEAVGLLAESGRHPDGVPLRWGVLTRHLLAQSVAVIRNFFDGVTAIPATLPVEGEPSWLTAVLGAELPPLSGIADLLTTALPATAAANGRVHQSPDFGVTVARSLCGPVVDEGAGPSIDLLVRVLHKMLDHEFRWPACIPLRDLAGEDFPLAQPILDLRADRGADDEDQLDSLGDGHSPDSVLSRALLAAAKRDYDPTTALLASVTHSGNRPLTAAITGALLGARHGIAGLPWVTSLAHLGVLETMAEDMYQNFALHGIWRESRSDRENWRRRYWPDADPVEV